MLAADGGSVLEGKLVQGVGEDEGRSVPPPLIQYPVMAPDEETGSVQGSAHDTEDVCLCEEWVGDGWVGDG